jgi:hypothetical protein
VLKQLNAILVSRDRDPIKSEHGLSLQWSMILSGLSSPAEAAVDAMRLCQSFAQAGKPSPLFAIMH